MLLYGTYEQFLVNLRVLNIPTHAYRRRRAAISQSCHCRWQVRMGANPNLFSPAIQMGTVSLVVPFQWLVRTGFKSETNHLRDHLIASQDHLWGRSLSSPPSAVYANPNNCDKRVNAYGFLLIWNIQSWRDCTSTFRGSTQNELRYDRSKIIKLKIHCMTLMRNPFPYLVLYTALGRGQTDPACLKCVPTT